MSSVKDSTGKQVHIGRPLGSPNLTTKALVTQILRTLDKLGGEAYLEKLAKSDKALFNALLARCIPRDVNISGTLTFEHRLAELESSREAIGTPGVMEATPPKALPSPSATLLPLAQAIEQRSKAKPLTVKPNPSEHG